ncbi:hypothetical protein [Polymorphospora rubra]|uniref:Uncharacterized protein n=1 Tax=Polymorphospora rubra TaxID=338584 RepID=A0A810MTZ3_9ACTN|nr:hypothetical protein [Polymorphospora rubra]BCJ63980.1 hypothetical protein Prubr_10010 [Polymorphospora rubra]
MKRDDPADQFVPPLGEPVEATRPGASEEQTTGPDATGSDATRPTPTSAEQDGDFADEHDNTTVDDDILTGEDVDREPEAPNGWAGLEEEP